MRRQNSLPNNYTSLPAFETIDGLDSYLYSGVRDYVRGWANFSELQTEQQKIINFLYSGLNGFLDENDLPQIKSLIKHLLSKKIVSSQELTLLQKKKPTERFLNKQNRKALTDSKQPVYEDETDGEYFRSLRDQLFGIEKRNANEAFVFEELKIQSELDKAFKTGGKTEALEKLKQIMNNEIEIDGVSQQWITDYSNLYRETEQPITLDNFYK